MIKTMRTIQYNEKNNTKQYHLNSDAFNNTFYNIVHNVYNVNNMMNNVANNVNNILDNAYNILNNAYNHGTHRD